MVCNLTGYWVSDKGRTATVFNQRPKECLTNRFDWTGIGSENLHSVNGNAFRLNRNRIGESLFHEQECRTEKVRLNLEPFGTLFRRQGWFLLGSSLPNLRVRPKGYFYSLGSTPKVKTTFCGGSLGSQLRWRPWQTAIINVTCRCTRIIELSNALCPGRTFEYDLGHARLSVWNFTSFSMENLTGRL